MVGQSHSWIFRVRRPWPAIEPMYWLPSKSVLAEMFHTVLWTYFCLFFTIIIRCQRLFKTFGILEHGIRWNYVSHYVTMCFFFQEVSPFWIILAHHQPGNSGKKCPAEQELARPPSPACSSASTTWSQATNKGRTLGGIRQHKRFDLGNWRDHNTI